MLSSWDEGVRQQMGWSTPTQQTTSWTPTQTTTTQTTQPQQQAYQPQVANYQQSPQLMQQMAQQQLLQQQFLPYAGLQTPQQGYNLTGGQYAAMPGDTSSWFGENPQALFGYWMGQSGMNPMYQDIATQDFNRVFTDYMMRRQVDPNYNLSFAQYLSAVDPTSMGNPYSMLSRDHSLQGMARQQQQWAWDPNQQHAFRQWAASQEATARQLAQYGWDPDMAIARLQFDNSAENARRTQNRFGWDPNQEHEKAQFEFSKRMLEEQQRQLDLQNLRQRGLNRFAGAAGSPRWVTY
jgi:hypothetical protein